MTEQVESHKQRVRTSYLSHLSSYSHLDRIYALTRIFKYLRSQKQTSKTLQS
jgi:hypothetical protein